MKLDLNTLCQEHAITPQGIIYVGAYDGKDLKRYQGFNDSKLLVIEANPRAYDKLQVNLQKKPNRQAVNYAILDQNGTINLHITSIESSSSIFPFKKYLEIYPNIKETQNISIPSRTLDTLLEELNLNPQDFNLLILDIQGAELLALKGAIQSLRNVQAICIRVDYEELFEGGALIDEVDWFLKQHDFVRVAQANPYHPSWGEAFYLNQQVFNNTHPQEDNEVVAPIIQPLAFEQNLQPIHEPVQQLAQERDQLLAELEQSQTQLHQTQAQLEQSNQERDQLLAELEQSQTQLHQTQDQLEQSNQERDQLLAELEQSQTQLHQTQAQLKIAQTKQQQTQQEFEQCRSQLHETRQELELTHLQLDEVQVELEHYVSQFHRIKEELQQTQDKLQQTQLELEQAKTQHPQEPTSSHRSKLGNAALVKVLAQVLADTLKDD